MMKIVFSGCMSLLLVCFTYCNDAVAQEQTYDATVAVKVKQLTQDEFDELEKLCAKTQDMSIDYVCVEAGLLVVKIYSSSYAEAGDVQMYITNKLREKLGKRTIEFLDVFVTKTAGVSKC